MLWTWGKFLPAIGVDRLGFCGGVGCAVAGGAAVVVRWRCSAAVGDRSSSLVRWGRVRLCRFTHRAVVAPRADGPLDAEGPARIATTLRDAPRDSPNSPAPLVRKAQ